MQNSLQATPLSKSTALEHSFIFSGDGWANGNTVTASKPVAVLNSLEALDDYIRNNPELISLDNAGFAGYIGYEGDCEFAVYEDMRVDGSQLIADRELGSDLKYAINYQQSTINYPNSQAYIDAVKKCQEYIREGDIYQANIAHKFTVDSSQLIGDEVPINNQLSTSLLGLRLYQKLCAINPAPYAGYMNFGDYEIISSSPELFLEIHPSGLVRSSPIKGTAKLNELDELLSSNKERAEHIMIVDLIRNDLGQVCETGSVVVEKLLYTQKLRNLYHLVSDIKGQLVLDQGSINFTKLFTAMCPGGSISGTPKIRALEIIEELETSPRGLYTGTIGYYRFRDGGRFNMLIRSLIYEKNNNILSLGVGSGITAGSDPEKELQETYLKAEKLLEVITISN